MWPIQSRCVVLFILQISVMSLWPGLGAIQLFLPTRALAQSVPGEAACLALNNTLNLPNTTILSITHVPANTTVDTAGSCQSTALSSSAICRLFFVTNTSSESAVHAEMWLPDDHNSRFLALGNGGLDGCKLAYSPV
jgi:feruloyl esterase